MTVGIKDVNQAGTGIRPLLVDATGLHSSPGNSSLTTGSYTLDATYGDIFCDCSGGNITLTFPTAVGIAGKAYKAFKTDSTTNTLTVNGTVMGSNTGVSVIEWISTGAAWKLARLYEEGTYTATLTGCTTSPTATYTYVRNGKSVQLNALGIVATSNTTACTITGMPSHIRPATTVNCMGITIRDNSLEHPGAISISAAGVINLFYFSAITTFTSTFTNANTKGLSNDVMINYTLL